MNLEVKSAVERDPLKIGAVLGDPTRYSIYQYIVQSGVEGVTAQEMANRFGLHPNVARLHLNKLKEIGVLVAQLEKSSRGGRPGQVYKLSGESVSLNLPPREYRLLSELLCRALSLCGDQGLVALEEVGRTYGRQVANQVYSELGLPPEDVSVDTLFEGAVRALSQQGLQANISRSPSGSATLTLSNCSFEEVAARYPRFICHLCHGLVQGVLETHLAVANVQDKASKARGDRHCSYFAQEINPSK